MNTLHEVLMVFRHTVSDMCRFGTETVQVAGRVCGAGAD